MLLKRTYFYVILYAMAYEVTATRRRPQRFEDLVGQEFVAETFRNSIQSGKIAHAYLFSGPRGCGKTSTARILAKALNCASGPTITPCGQCQNCKEITAGSSLDVIEIDGASNTSVNDVRQIKDEVLFPPNSSRYKIYIIDEVHMLSTSAFNALLKTIEEPPPYVIFIFATTELQKVPATIKSRCQQFNFRLVPVEKVKEQLALAAKEIGVKAEDEALYWVAREAGGSMRDSYTLFDQVAAFSGGEITYEKIRDKLGLVGTDSLNALFELCVVSDTSSALLLFDDYMQNGVSLEQLISNCSDYLRSLLLIKNGVTREALLGQNASRFSKKVLDAWSPVQIERALSIFLQLYRDIRYSLNPRFEAELAVSRLCWLKDYTSPSEVKKAIDAVKPLLLKSARSQSQPQEVAKAAVSTAFKAHFSALDEIEENEEAASEVSQVSDPFDRGGQQEAAESYVDPDGYSMAAPDDSPAVQETASVDFDVSDCDKVRETIISDFSVNDGLLSGVLSKTFSWTYSDGKINAKVESKFDIMQLEQNIVKIQGWLKKTFAKDILFHVQLEEARVNSVKEEIPLQVQIIKDIFKGSIVGGS